MLPDKKSRNCEWSKFCTSPANEPGSGYAKSPDQVRGGPSRETENQINISLAGCA
ncbi:hypothetical protein MNBD_ALPHA11-104 [hydrothermal vent metagenome]|uniref:Uncharacterized protein n=1 Tax=hydrothermal vent metagenome TaxID=652676 RepID=A0A3B0UQH0_9ZZZZ